MAQRYGSKYSPDGKSSDKDSPYKDAKPSRAGARTNWLFIAPLPMIAFIWGDGPVIFGIKLAGFATLLLAAWLTREGVFAHEAYDARTVARRPAFPRKIAGSVCMALGLTLAAFPASGLGAIVLGLAGAGLHLFSFGPDPLQNKGIDGVDQFQQDRVARVVDEAEKSLGLMSAAVADLGDRDITRRVEKFQSSARMLFRRVEEDPQDLTAARKFMSVYLNGAKDATLKFAQLYGRGRDPQVRKDFETFLDDLEGNFEAKTETLLANNKTDLEIEMKVLRDRLEREGLTSQT